MGRRFCFSMCYTISNTSMKGRIILLIILLGALISLAWFVFRDTSGSARKTNQLQGNLSKITGDSLFVSGKYVNPINKKPFSGDFIDVEVDIASSTQIIRVGLQLPSAEELKKTNGYFKVDDLKKEETVVDLAILKNDSQRSAISLTAMSADDIYNSKKFQASEIIYRTAN